MASPEAGGQKPLEEARRRICSRAILISTLLMVVPLDGAPRTSSAMTTTGRPDSEPPQRADPAADAWVEELRKLPASKGEQPAERRAFVVELLKMLHQQYGAKQTGNRQPAGEATLEERRSQVAPGQIGAGPQMMSQLVEALGADGDVRRLVDWVRDSMSPAAIPEIATQFVVGKLGAVNCPALLQPDPEDALAPRFLLFNDHFVDVPFELTASPGREECAANGKFDPRRRTVLLVHGYLTGYTLVDGLTNIKNRLLDLNRAISERAIRTFERDSAAHLLNNSSFVYTEDLSAKLTHQMYNVIIVDWFNGANPTPRANYIRAAVNAQVVGRLIARFVSALVVQCGAPASSIQIIAHSLGCHVTGFTGKALNAAGHRLGKITHLDPVGLCFGRLFSQPRFRLSPDDALETQAVHTSLNLFDNPLDGAHSNFLVNGGRDQLGCGGPSELTNSTTSSVALLFDPAAKFGACSHMRALNLFEEDQSSGPEQCQMVGYRCASYDKFLAGKCGACDAANSQCRLMGLAPLSMQFRQMSMAAGADDDASLFYDPTLYEPRANITVAEAATAAANGTVSRAHTPAWAQPSTSAPPSTKMYGAPSYLVQLNGNELAAAGRSDRSLDKRERLAQMLEKLRADTQTAIAGWSSLRKSPPGGPPPADLDSLASGETGRPETVQLAPPQPEAAPALAARGGRPAESRAHAHPPELAPVGGQRGPSGALHGPLYFLGTSATASYCLNYYQFRVLIAASRLREVINRNGLGSNRLAPQLSQQQRGGVLRAAAAAAALQQRVANANGRDMLHLTVKLADAAGRFFKGFSVLEHARSLARAPAGPGEPLLELTMLLNSTRTEPQRVGEAILSYYFHQIVLADRVEVNYMSNISPEIRARYSSVLCPVAINDRHQLVRYIECHKVAPAA